MPVQWEQVEGECLPRLRMWNPPATRLRTGQPDTVCARANAFE